MLSYQTFVTFPGSSYLLNLCCFINFCHLIKLLSFSHPLLSIRFLRFTHPINAHAVHTTTQLLLAPYRAHALCANTLSQLNRCPWPSCHSDMGGSRHGWGFPTRTTRYTIGPPYQSHQMQLNRDWTGSSSVIIICHGKAGRFHTGSKLC